MTSGDPTGAFGSAYIASDGSSGEITWSGGQHIAGNLVAEPGVKVPNADTLASGVDGQTDLAADLTAAVSEINALASTIDSAACTDTLTDGTALYGTFDTTNKNVICFSGNKDVDLKNPVTLTGSGSHTVYIKVDRLSFSSTFTVVPPLSVDQIVWYIQTAGSTVAGRGEISGTILAPLSSVDLSKSQVTGSVLGGKDIKLSKGSSVGCPP